MSRRSATVGARPRLWGGWLGDAVLAAVTGVAATIFAALTWGVTPELLRQRWSFGGVDGVLHYGLFQSALDVFPYLPNGELGFPAAQNLFFSPQFDPWSSLFVTVSSAFTKDGIFALDLYELLSFLAAGITAYLFFRALGLRRLPAMLWGGVFAVLPYHFFQIVLGHPFVANYWAVPLAGILAIVIGARDSPIDRWITASRRPRVTRILLVIALAVTVGLTQSYFYVMGAILLGGLWLFRMVGTLLTDRRSWRELWWPTVHLTSLAVTIGAYLALLSLNWGDRYAKYFQELRGVTDSETYGGKITQLLMPDPFSGIPWISKLADKYGAISTLAPWSEQPAPSLLNVIALLVAMAAILVLLVVGRRRPVERSNVFWDWIDNPVVRPMLFGFLWALLFYTLAGLGPVFAFVFSPEIRAWSRISIFIYLFTMGAFAVLAERLLRNAGLRWVLGIVLAIATVLDVGVGMAKNLPAVPADDSEIQGFAAELDTELAPGCGIVQLPLEQFPEGGISGKMGDYDEFLPYLYSDGGFRFSFGAVRDTHSADVWSTLTTPAAVAAETVAAGSCAVLIDTNAYTDHDPSEWEDIVRDLGLDPHSPGIRSTSGRWLLFEVPA